MSANVKFDFLSMCWNSEEVEPFAFNNTITVKDDHPLTHLLAWTATVARGGPGGKLKALVINCHGFYGHDYAGTMDSAGGIPTFSGGFGLHIGIHGERVGINLENAGSLFQTLAGLVNEIHLYACGTAHAPTPTSPGSPIHFCQLVANSSKAVVVGSNELQDDVVGPGLNLAPPMAGRVIRFTPEK